MSWAGRIDLKRALKVDYFTLVLFRVSGRAKLQSIFAYSRFAVSVKARKFFQVIATLSLLAGLTACGEKNETEFSEEPKGYVEFYMPEPRLGEESIGVDTQVYRIVNGRREFLGMTLLWKGLAEPRRGLTVAVPPGEQRFVVVHGSAEAPVSVEVEMGAYHRVRIEMTGVSARQMIGATRQIRFGLQATVEKSP